MQRYILISADGQPVVMVHESPAAAVAAWAQYCDGFEDVPPARRAVRDVLPHWNQSDLPAAVSGAGLIDQECLKISPPTGGWMSPQAVEDLRSVLRVVR